MKTRNFPARKLARQIAAKEGGSCRHYLNDKRVLAARQSRSKKRSTGAAS